MGEQVVKTIFVTGATGFIGRSLVGQLIREGWKVKGLARDSAKTWKQKGLTWVMGDIRDTSWLPAVAGCRVLIHAAGVHGYRQVPWKERLEIELTGTKNIIKAVERYRVSYIIYISTAYTELATEYARAKQIALAWLQSSLDQGSASPAGRLPATVIRPVTVYGPGDTGNSLRLFQAIARRRFALIGGGGYRAWFLFIDDLVGGIIRLLAKPERYVGKTLVFSPKTAVLWRDLVDLIAREEGVPAPAIRLPVPIAKAAGRVGSWLSSLGLTAPITSDAVTMLTARPLIDWRPTDELLGNVAVTELRGGIAKTVAWYRKHKLV